MAEGAASAAPLPAELAPTAKNAAATAAPAADHTPANTDAPTTEGVADRPPSRQPP
jgi:hypothetical protein